MKLTCFLALFVLTTAAVAEEHWKNLFDGQDLGNWEVKGGVATYAIEGDAIVGTSAPNTENTFLVTKDDYADFILEFEFKGHPALNSGVQVRSQSLPEFKNGRVHGYQVELEDEGRDRAWSGGIYDEARRGWLYPSEGQDSESGKAFSAEGKAAWKTGEWNHVRVEAVGDRVQTWINGVKRADLRDDMDSSGFIGLQVHGVGSRTEPMSVYWRNLRIQELPKSEPQE
jgi:hypothetical protein